MSHVHGSYSQSRLNKETEQAFLTLNPIQNLWSTQPLESMDALISGLVRPPEGYSKKKLDRIFCKNKNIDAVEQL